MVELGRVMDTLRGDLMNALLGWDLLAQAEHVCEVVRYWRHVADGSRYPATDRELRALAILIAYDALGGKPGVHRFASGAAVLLGEDLDTEAGYHVEGQPLPSDFPHDIARLITRMVAEQQAARDAELPRLHRQEQEAHRQAAEIRAEGG